MKIQKKIKKKDGSDKQMNDKSTFKITEESIEDWIENSNKKQSDLKNQLNSR